MSNETVAAIADHYGLTIEQMRGPERAKVLTIARFAATYVLRTRDNLSFPTIARMLGRKDHTTMIHALGRANSMRRYDQEFCDLTDYHAALPALCRTIEKAPVTAAKKARERVKVLEPAPPHVTRKQIACFETVHIVGIKPFKVDKNGLEAQEINDTDNIRKCCSLLLKRIQAAQAGNAL